MKLELKNNRWYDENNNSWNAYLETEESARKKSESLSNCSYCRDCSDCSGCRDCSDCSGCRDCSDCSGCRDCRCCSGCSYCRCCSGCSDCRYCRCCSGCSDCRCCSYCSGWKSDPQRLVSGEMGSRNGQTTIYFDNGRTEVVCGCFRGTVEEFESAIDKTHGDNEHGIAYRAWLEKANKYIEAMR